MVLDVKFARALPVPIATPSSFNELRQNRHFSQGDSGDFVTDCSPSVSRPVCVDRTPGTSSVPTRYIGPARRLHLSMLPGTLVHSANFLVALVSFFATVRLISPLQKDALRINITPPLFLGMIRSDRRCRNLAGKDFPERRMPRRHIYLLHF